MKLVNPVKLEKKKGPFKLPIVGTVAEAASMTKDTYHVIFANTSIKDFILKYKIEHELCHLKLNEMDIRSLANRLKEIEFKNNVERNKSLTVALFVYEFYAEWLCHEAFGVPKEIVEAFAEAFAERGKVRTMIKSGMFAFVMQLTCLLLYKRLGYSVNIDITAEIVREYRPELAQWMVVLDDFSKKLPKLPVSIDGTFINNIYEMTVKIYPKNPIAIQ